MNIGGDISWHIAFFSGMASFFSPCLLPMIPAYVLYIAGAALDSGERVSRRLAVWRTLGFVLGFTIVFLLFGLSASAAGRFFLSNKMLFQRIAGILIILFGLQFVGVIKLSALSKTFKFRHMPRENSWLGACLMGLAFGAGWTPCFGPVLASILVMASASKSIGSGVGLLLVYAIGMGVPFILTAVFINEVTPWLSKLSRSGLWIQRIAGVILIIFGIFMAMDWLVKLNALVY
jgi:cytochrome c-type biogenesis protein